MRAGGRTQEKGRPQRSTRRAPLVVGQRAAAGDRTARGLASSLIESFEPADLLAAARPVAAEHPFADRRADEIDRRYLVHVLEAAGGSRTRAAEILAIDRRTLYRMAERFGMPLNE